MLPKFYVGDLETIELPAINVEHRQMIQDLEDAGLFETNMGDYYRLSACLALALAGVVSCVLLSSSFAVHMLCAVVLGCFWNQCNFIGHDTGHNGITKNRKVDSLVGLFAGNMMTGISIGWWKVGSELKEKCRVPRAELTSVPLSGIISNTTFASCQKNGPVYQWQGRFSGHHASFWQGCPSHVWNEINLGNSL